MTYLGQFMCAKSKKSSSIIEDSTNQTFQNTVSLNRTAQTDISKKSNLQREASQTVTDELALLILAVVVTIPFGKVASYGQVAALAGLPKHARLVGRVLSRMDDSSEVPWHRVINAQGRISLSRLDDLGFNEQQARLLSEGVVIKNGKINFKDFGWNI